MINNQKEEKITVNYTAHTTVHNTTHIDMAVITGLWSINNINNKGKLLTMCTPPQEETTSLPTTHSDLVTKSLKFPGTTTI